MRAWLHCVLHLHVHMRVYLRFVEKRGGAERYGEGIQRLGRTLGMCVCVLKVVMFVTVVEEFAGGF